MLANGGEESVNFNAALVGEPGARRLRQDRHGSEHQKYSAFQTHVLNRPEYRL